MKKVEFFTPWEIIKILGTEHHRKVIAKGDFPEKQKIYK